MKAFVKAGSVLVEAAAREKGEAVALTTGESNGRATATPHECLKRQTHWRATTGDGTESPSVQTDAEIVGSERAARHDAAVPEAEHAGEAVRRAGPDRGVVLLNDCAA